MDFALFLQKDHGNVNSNEVVPFLKQMKIWTFFQHIIAICIDTFGFDVFEKCKWFDRSIIKIDLQNKILNDILSPEFTEEKPNGAFAKVLAFKFRRWWHNRWKHPLVYDEWLIPMFFTLLWSHLRRWETIKD